MFDKQRFKKKHKKTIERTKRNSKKGLEMSVKNKEQPENARYNYSRITKTNFSRF